MVGSWCFFRCVVNVVYVIILGIHLRIQARKGSHSLEEEVSKEELTMSQIPPSWPPKEEPTRHITQTPPVPPKPETPTSNSALQSPNPTPPIAITLPANLVNLPTHELQKLLTSVKELKGYVMSLLDTNIQQNITKLDDITLKLQGYISQLEQLEDSKAAVNTDLANLDILIQRWQQLQVEMFDVIQKKFSTDALRRSLNNLVNDTRVYSEHLRGAFVNDYDIDQHSEQSIQKFISNYKDFRKSYHLRSAKLQRLNENRIGGLY